MTPAHIYTGHNLNPAYNLHYGWTAWPSKEPLPPKPPPVFFTDLAQFWAEDGIRLQEHTWSPDHIQMTFSMTPQASPIFLAQRAKGRLQHALRQAGTPVKFSRKVTLRSIGDNLRGTVEQYVAKQTEKGQFADPSFSTLLDEFSIDNPSINLASPSETNSGRYWYNLHLVLVVAGRHRFGAPITFEKLRAAALSAAAQHTYGISRLSMMPDHLHVALRGNIEESPQEIALTFQNALAIALGNYRVWEYNFYVGTFSEYDLKAVRRS